MQLARQGVQKPSKDLLDTEDRGGSLDLNEHLYCFPGNSRFKCGPSRSMIEMKEGRIERDIQNACVFGVFQQTDENI